MHCSLGMARRIREELKVPIVCGLAGEDWFLEQLREPHYSQARRSCASAPPKSIGSWLTTITSPISWPTIWVSIASRIDVIRHGLDLNGHGARSERTAGATVYDRLFRPGCAGEGFACFD